MFGTSGIRGLYGKAVHEPLAYAVAYAFAQKSMVIGRDTRRSGPSLMEAAVAGATHRGAEAIDLGIVPTPTVALATLKHHCQGIMLTASHNPEEYQGLKLLEEGKEILRAQEQQVAQAITSTPKPLPSVRPALSDPVILDDHKTLVRSLVEERAIASKKPKVIADCNGAGAVITPSLLTDLGCHSVSLNAQLSGFNRPPEPTVGHLAALSKIVRATGASLGIAHDGDADRAVILDERGELLGPDVQLALAIEQELEHSSNKLVLTTVEASLLVREQIERLGGRYEIGPVGSTGLSHALEREHAAFAGEPCGEYIYARATHHCPDGVLAAAKFAQLFAEKGPLSQQKARFKPYPMLREKFVCSKKAEAMKRILGAVVIEGERNEEDGLRVDEEDGWFLIRASGTEPVIRLTAEYKDKKKLEERAASLKYAILHSL